MRKIAVLLIALLAPMAAHAVINMGFCSGGGGTAARVTCHFYLYAWDYGMIYQYQDRCIETTNSAHPGFGPTWSGWKNFTGVSGSFGYHAHWGCPLYWDTPHRWAGETKTNYYPTSYPGPEDDYLPLGPQGGPFTALPGICGPPP